MREGKKLLEIQYNTYYALGLSGAVMHEHFFTSKPALFLFCIKLFVGRSHAHNRKYTRIAFAE